MQRSNTGWRRLFSPHPHLRGSPAYREAQLLIAVIGFIIVLGSILVIVYEIEAGWPLLNGDLDSLFSLGILVGYSGLYYLALTLLYRWALPPIIVSLLLAIFVISLPDVPGVYNGFLVYYVLPVILTQLFYDDRATLLVIAVASAAFVLYASYVPDITINDLELGYFGLVSGFIVLAGRHQRQMTAIRNNQLRDSERRYRLLVEQSPDAILVTSRTDLLYANPAARALIGGRLAMAPLPMPMNAFVREDFSGDLQSIVSRDFQLDPPQQFAREIHLELYDGRKLVAMYSSAPITYQGEAARQIIARDITQQRQLEQQQQQVEMEQSRLEMLQEFITGLSHDLKTPLTIINTKLYLLERSATTPQQKKHIDTLTQHVDHLGELLDTLLTMLRLDRTPAFVFRATDLNDFVSSLAARYTSVIQARHQTLDTDLGENLPRVKIDVDEMGQAIKHLLTNAVQYTSKGGSITLCTRRAAQPGFLVLEVQDQGMGISDKDIQHIFDHFYRADPARSVETGGVGLGLTISRKIIEMHGGRVEVESQVGQGTTFFVHLPIATEKIPSPMI